MQVTKYKLVSAWNPFGITEEEQTRRTVRNLLEERSHPNINLILYYKRKKPVPIIVILFHMCVFIPFLYFQVRVYNFIMN